MACGSVAANCRLLIATSVVGSFALAAHKGDIDNYSRVKCAGLPEGHGETQVKRKPE
jgi:hypothetical protein